MAYVSTLVVRPHSHGFEFRAQRAVVPTGNRDVEACVDVRFAHTVGQTDGIDERVAVAVAVHYRTPECPQTDTSLGCLL